jgi:putative ABC transport system ATP-binding protein
VNRTAAQAPRLIARGLSFAYPGRDGRAGFSLEVPELELGAGEAVALIGPSGSGKSTFVHLLAGLLQPRSGELQVGGRAIGSAGESDRRAWRRDAVGLVFQDLELLEYLSAEDNVLLAARLRDGRAGEAQRARAASLLEQAGLTERRRAKPARLSGGERQRVAVCRALLGEPDLLLGDEPTGSLDPATGLQVLDLLFAERERRGASLLMITHDHSLLPRFDRVWTTRFSAPGRAVLEERAG